MSVVLSEQLPLLATAPDGIQKLRGLILELAVRGKLVPQDPKDEPASELLKRIAKERARLEVEGTCKKSNATPLDAGDAPPFELPAGWVLSQLSDLALVLNGRAYSKDELLSEGVPVLRVGNLFTSNHWYYSNLQLEADKYCDQGDLLYSWSASFGPFIWQGPKVIYHYHIWKLRLFDESSLSKEFFYKFLLEKTAEIMAAGHGVSMIHMTKEKMEKILVPFPPLAEQHRIVAKVDELMALCDRLEAEQTDAESAHAKLVETLLGTLRQSRDADELVANWQRLAEYFDSLMTTSSSVDALKKAILDLATDGRLVTQYGQAEICSLSAVIEGDSLNGCSKKPSDTPSGVQILRISAGTGNDDFFVDEEEHKWVDATPAEILKFRLLPDDLLACRFNGNLHYVGSFSLYQGTSGVSQIFPDKLIRFRAERTKVLPHYLRYALNATSVRVQIESFCATTVGNIGISASNLKTVKVRVPDIPEQQRIVAKVDELMALCDRLKADLTESRIQQARLSATLIDAALQAA